LPHVNATPSPLAVQPEITVMLCRDCCCGSTAKHPDSDHDAQRRSLESMTESGLRVRVVDCLDVCARSNVVLVRRHRRRRSERDVWLEKVLTAADTGELQAWLRDGAQDDHPLLDRLRFVNVHQGRRGSAR
jgi:hypothetical protein